MRIPSARLTLPVLVWAVLYATHAFLGYYHDDYAYAGLTYSYTVEGPYSERLTLLNYVNYLYQHYMGWGGRIVAFGIAIPFMHAGPSVFWFVQSLLVTGILCFGASIAARFTAREDFPQTLLFLLASYMSMKIVLVRDGLYWASASVLYVWPQPALAFNLSCWFFVLLSGSRQSQAGNELSKPEHSSSGGIA